MKLFQYKGPSVYDGPPYAPDSRHFVVDEYWLLEKDDPILRCKPPLPFEEVEKPPDCDNVESLKELVETCKLLRAWIDTVGRAMGWNLKTVGLVFKDHRAIARALVIPRIVQLIDAAVRLGRTERPATDGLDETGALAVLNGVVEWVGEVGPHAPSPNPYRKKDVNARMLDKIQKDQESHGWSSTQWARYLKCSPPSVVATATWKRLAETRERLSAERAKDRRRR